MAQEKNKKKAATPKRVAAKREKTLPPKMDFGMAINFAKDGQFVCREKWEAGKFVFLADFEKVRPSKNYPTGFTKFLAISSPDGYADPYTPSNQDIMASDWVLA